MIRRVLLQALDAFLSKDRIGIFAKLRNNPNEPGALSGLSCYIHFGQLGMQRAALRCVEVKSKFRVRACLWSACGGCRGSAQLCKVVLKPSAFSA